MLICNEKHVKVGMVSRKEPTVEVSVDYWSLRWHMDSYSAIME